MAEETRAGSLRMVLVSHDRKLVDTACAEVTLPGREGELGVLPGHTAFLAALKPGCVRLEGAAGDAPAAVAIGPGFVEVSNDVVTVLVDEAHVAGDLDAAAARTDLEQAQLALDRAPADELEAAQDRVALIEGRIEVLDLSGAAQVARRAGI